MNQSLEGADVHMDTRTLRVRGCFANGMALILTAVVIACDSSPTAPSVQSATDGGGQVFATAVDPGLPQNKAALKATAPGLVSPADGAEVSDPAVVLTATNPLAVHNVPWQFDVRFEIYANSNPEQPVYSQAVPQGQGTTRDDVPGGVLQNETLYVWRARAESEGEIGPWSTVNGFTIVEPPVPPAPVGGGCCPPPNRLAVVLQVAADTGYPDSGISAHDFTQRVAERLAAEDANWGRYLNSNGNLGKDTVSYRVNGQKDNPFKIDIVRGAASSSPSPHWTTHGLGDGTWKQVN